MTPTENTIRLKDYPRRHVQSSMSPFRYPGGKGFLTGYLSEQLEKLPRENRIYVEPFCGGAGAALNLLSDDLVDSIHLNDLDPRIYSAWRAMLLENDRFLERLNTTPVSIESWWTYRDMLTKPLAKYDFDLGFATYFINRTSRSGIVTGSGPIGGYDQKGAYKIDARFYKETMSRRIEWIGENSDRILISNAPGIDFLKEHTTIHDPEHAFYFIDPPYVVAGSRLYLNAMDHQTHATLASVLKSWPSRHWLLTYDDDPLVRRLYRDCNIMGLEVSYSLSRTRKAREILIRAT